ERSAHAGQTRPPPGYTEATLLSAMEGAGKLVEDDELRAAMEAKGLGTPATRAAIIEGLIYEDYVHREGRELVPTPKAFSLLFALHVMSIPELASPELTGEWEHKLKLIELRKFTREEFMQHISQLVTNVVSIIKTGDIPDTAFATVPAPCPKCGGVVQENYRKFQCQKCDFSLWKVVSGREWSPDEVAELITKRFIGPLTGFRSCDVRSGRMILQEPVEREQMKKLLATGRTDLLTGFVSKKGRRFKAFLVKTPDGKVGFEFQPRAAKERPDEQKPVKKKHRAA